MGKDRGNEIDVLTRRGHFFHLHFQVVPFQSSGSSWPVNLQGRRTEKSCNMQDTALLRRDRGTTLDDVTVEPQKVCIVTGANSGVGFETALKMTALDYEVILACRDAHRGNAAVARIQQQIPECEVSFMQLDLASLKSVRNFVDNFHKTGKRLNVLINNAGKRPIIILLW